MEQTKNQINSEEAWEEALKSWHTPSIPQVITQIDERVQPEVRKALAGELAFMSYPDFQTYANLENIVSSFPEDPQRGIRVVLKHEVGHRFCPYDSITLILLRHYAQKALEGKEIPIDKQTAIHKILNLFTDENINTQRSKNSDSDIPWAYEQLSKKNSESALWRVYAKSMELAWDTKLLPEEVKLEEKEQKAAERLAKLFEGNFFDREKWSKNIGEYASTIADFFEPTSKSGRSDGKGKSKSSKGEDTQGEISTGFDDITKNIPSHIDDKTAEELAKRVAGIGSDGMPKNPSGLEEFKELMAGFGKGEATEASIYFYDMLSKSYDVMFATRPFGRPRTNPFQPIKWTPSMGIERLDVDYSAQVGGKLIPGVNTYSWNTRKRESKGGIEEVVPDLDLFLDSSESMPNPILQISLPVLAAFVVAKKAHRKRAKLRLTNYSGQEQYETTGFTSDLREIFKKAVKYYNGGTIFPTNVLREGASPRHVLVITDTGLFNASETAEAISEFRRKHKGNRVTVYAVHDFANADYLGNAGAEVIQDTTTNIFKRAIGKANEVYSK